MRDHFIKALTSIAERDPRIVLLTGDLGFGVLTSFAERFARQYLNVGVAEQNMTGIATGLAMSGKIVFTYSIGNFPTLRCLEEIRNDVCYHDANVKVVAIGGGFSYGPLGISHHATEDLAILRALPNMIIVSPCDHWETEEATKAIAARHGPAYLRLDKSAAPNTHTAGEVFELGKVRKIREGYDVTLAATGGILEEVLDASDQLESYGVRSRVLSVHTIVPLDLEAFIAASKETSGLVTVEEHTVHGGLGSAVAENLLELGIVPKFFRRIGLRAGFSSIVGSQAYLRKQYGMDATAVVNTVLNSLSVNGVRDVCQAGV